MKYISVSLFLLIFNISNIFSQVEKIIWRGWENCYRLKNQKCEVIINASAGGKVAWFALGGKNIIYENTQQDGKILHDWQQNHFDPDGGRFDVGPEKLTHSIHTLSWLGAWNAEIVNNNSIKLTSAPDSLLGLQSIREFALHPDSAVLLIKLSATNITNQEIVRHFWSRTLLTPGGVMYLPINTSGSFAKGWGRFLWNPARIDTLPESDERIKIDAQIFTFLAVGSALKGGADAMDGWMSYRFHNLEFKKTFPVYPKENYSGSEHMTTIFYSNGKFIELEPCSPTYNIDPGKTISFFEKWELKEAQ